MMESLATTARRFFTVNFGVHLIEAAEFDATNGHE
jgi:hypothetical protein